MAGQCQHTSKPALFVLKMCEGEVMSQLKTIAWNNCKELLQA